VSISKPPKQANAQATRLMMGLNWPRLNMPLKRPSRANGQWLQWSDAKSHR
jgi:hypothetical protein